MKREGFGAVLADGVKKAAERIGRGAEEYAVHVHGQEVPYHDPRLEPDRGAMCFDTTPGRHTRSGTTEVTDDLAPYLKLQVPAVDPKSCQGKGQIYALSIKRHEVFVSCGFCVFPGIGNLPLEDIISAATGWDFTASKLLAAGERIQTLR